MNRISRIKYNLTKRKNRRQALRFVENMIMNGGVEIKFNSEPVELIPGCDDYVDTYNIYPIDKQFLTLAPNWFDKQDIVVVSLVRTDGAFFTDYTLEFNHKEFEVPERKARWLYDQAQLLKSQQPKIEKTM